MPGLLVRMLSSVAILCFLLINPATHAATSTILVLGDSISAEYGLPRGSGWVALLQKKLTDEGFAHTIVNASISGETTAGGRSRIKGLLSKHEPAVVIIELGGNDALRGLDLNSSQSNLQTIASASKQAGARLLVLGMQVPPNYGPAYTEQFAAIFKDVADKHQAALVPFFLVDIAQDDQFFQPDGIHPTQAAQPVLLKTMWDELLALLKK